MASSDDAFAMCINHGGEIQSDLFYVGGHLHRVLDLDADKFGYLDLEEEIKNLGYVSWKSITYKLPNSAKYVELHNDVDVMAMLVHRHDKCRVFHIFIDCGKKLGADLVVDEEEVETGNGNGRDSSEEDVDYVPSEIEDYTDD